MLTVGDALTKTLTKSQKITFWSQKNSFKCFFFLLTVGDALSALMENRIFSDVKGGLIITPKRDRHGGGNTKTKEKG